MFSIPTNIISIDNPHPYTTNMCQKSSYELCFRKALEWLGKRHLKLDEQPRDPSASPSIDSPTTSDREPSLPAATNKGKGKAVAKTGVVDLPSEASRSSPFPGADRTSDAEMEDADSNEVAATEPADETTPERAEVISALRRFLTWSDRF
ncbi:hypothetical protein FGLOB1_3912 [Fusarium globosum]|uniref:Uncharacterized protein n=1 Tax=Fusarium globosum TaxID=78864 RepID=A0A8H5YJX8_9HYPO|nr:hypothetical protein FGLOB1_3912 [Fusarium globosum]